MRKGLGEGRALALDWVLSEILLDLLVGEDVEVVERNPSSANSRRDLAEDLLGPALALGRRGEELG